MPSPCLWQADKHVIVSFYTYSISQKRRHKVDFRSSKKASDLKQGDVQGQCPDILENYNQHDRNKETGTVMEVKIALVDSKEQDTETDDKEATTDISVDGEKEKILYSNLTLYSLSCSNRCPTRVSLLGDLGNQRLYSKNFHVVGGAYQSHT